MSTSDGISIAMKPDKATLHISSSVPFDPQPMHVSVHLRRVRDLEIEVDRSLCGKGRFIWEYWRDNFASRLAGMSRWQQQNDLEHSPVSRTNESITAGLRYAKLSAFGTGQEMLIWAGWLPHRANLSLFEVAPKEFIVQIEREPLDLEWSPRFTGKQLPGLYKSRHAPVQYATASSLDLEHASAVAHHVLHVLAQKCAAGADDLVFDGESMLVEAKELVAFGVNQVDFQLKLAEAVAIYHHNFEALERIVLFIVQGSRHWSLW